MQLSMAVNMEMELIDALEIVKEISIETIEKESVKVEDVTQEREAISLVDKMITVFAKHKRIEELIKEEIRKL